MSLVNNTVERAEYTVHSFMRDIGVRGSALDVYALIYSFTKGVRGMFFGTRAYLARALGISERSVYRALKILFDKKLIERTENCELGISGIRCTEHSRVREENKKEPLPKAESDLSDQYKKEESTQNLKAGSVPFWTDEKREAAYKRIVARRFGRLSADEEQMVISEYKAKSVNPSSVLLRLGKEERVLMTSEQYKNLASTINADQLHTYIERLEAMLIRNDETGLRCSKSHYKVIKRWIEEDLRC